MTVVGSGVLSDAGASGGTDQSHEGVEIGVAAEGSEMLILLQGGSVGEPALDGSTQPVQRLLAHDLEQTPGSLSRCLGHSVGV